MAKENGECLKSNELEKLNTVVFELRMERQMLGQKIPATIRRIEKVLQAELPRVGTAA